MKITNNYNHQNKKIGFSAFYYDKEAVKRMPKKFQKAFEKVLPELERENVVSDCQLYAFPKDIVGSMAWFKTTMKKQIGNFNGILTGIDKNSSIINTIDTTAQKIKHAFYNSKINARNDLNKQLIEIIDSIYLKQENRDYSRKMRREINKLCKGRNYAGGRK